MLQVPLCAGSTGNICLLQPQLQGIGLFSQAVVAHAVSSGGAWYKLQWVIQDGISYTNAQMPTQTCSLPLYSSAAQTGSCSRLWVKKGKNILSVILWWNGSSESCSIPTFFLECMFLLYLHHHDVWPGTVQHPNISYQWALQTVCHWEKALQLSW